VNIGNYLLVGTMPVKVAYRYIFCIYLSHRINQNQ